jgi:hypothetical protein
MTEFVEKYNAVYKATVSEIEDVLRKVTKEYSDAEDLGYIAINQLDNRYEVSSIVTYYCEPDNTIYPLVETPIGYVEINHWYKDPDRKTEVIIYGYKDSYELWANLIVALGENFLEVLIDRSSSVKTQAPLLRDFSIGKPGRKPDSLYDQAYQKVIDGESIGDVYKWWCHEANISRPDKGTRDAFKAAIKRRRNKS